MGCHQPEEHMHLGVPVLEEREKAERIFEKIMAEIFPNLMRDMNINIQKAQQSSSKMNSERPTLKHILIKLSRDRDRILKAAREK